MSRRGVAISTVLRDRLDELADEAPASLPVGSAQLWRRGRRRQVRQRAVTSLLLVVVLAGLGGAVALGGLIGTTARPAGGADAVRLPDRFFTPSPWLHGTKAHPIGPLVAVFGAERRAWHGWRAHPGNGVVAVSARTGEYRFLDLPGSATEGTAGTSLGNPFNSTDTQVSLSPDGRSIAYWLAGPVQGIAGKRTTAVVGYAIYDTTSGAVTTTQRAADAPSGVSPAGFAWTTGQLWAQYGNVGNVREDGYSVAASVTQVIDLATGAVTAEARPFDLEDVFQGPAGFTYEAGRDLVQVSGRGETRRVGAVGWSAGGNSEDHGAFVSPDGRLLAIHPALAGSSGPYPAGGPTSTVIALDRTPGAQGQSSSVSSEGIRRLLGWRDDLHLLVLTDDSVLQSVDIRSGARVPLSQTTAAWTWMPGLALAADALDAEPARGREPAAAPDPRLLLGLVGLSAGAAALLVGRTIRRRRGRT